MHGVSDPFTCTARGGAAASHKIRRLFQGPMHLINRRSWFISSPQHGHTRIDMFILSLDLTACLPGCLTVCLLVWPHSIFINHPESTVPVCFSKTDFYGHVTCWPRSDPKCQCIWHSWLQNWWCDLLPACQFSIDNGTRKPFCIGNVNKKFGRKVGTEMPAEAWHYSAELNEPNNLLRKVVKWFNDT